MKQHKVVQLPIKQKFLGSEIKPEETAKALDQYSKDGWETVSIFPSDFSAQGGVYQFSALLAKDV